jgi:hypothetical protein
LKSDTKRSSRSMRCFFFLFDCLRFPVVNFIRFFSSLSLSHSFYSYTPGQADVETFSKFPKEPDAKSWPFLNRWWNHIKFFNATERQT